MPDQTPRAMYMASKDAISSLITEENQTTPIPACPNWTLRDMLGHLTGCVEDVAAGNVEDLGESHWTAAQVSRYADRNLAGVKQAWSDVIAACRESFADIAVNALPDVAVHEFDVRGALGNMEYRSSPLLTTIFPFFTGIADNVFREAGLPALRILADSEEAVLGEGEPQATLSTTAFEASRFFTGRRSLAQMHAMNWSVDPEPWLQHISLMSPRATDLVE